MWRPWTFSSLFKEKKPSSWNLWLVFVWEENNQIQKISIAILAWGHVGMHALCEFLNECIKLQHYSTQESFISHSLRQTTSMSASEEEKLRLWPISKAQQLNNPSKWINFYSLIFNFERKIMKSLLGIRREMWESSTVVGGAA